LLDARGTEFTYREYTQDPLSVEELQSVLHKLGMTATQVLRSRDARKAGLSGNETDDELITLMASNPRLLQRPILVTDSAAALGRPIENLLTLL
jgi:arsenate reductase (glutaredoxin)